MSPHPPLPLVALRNAVVRMGTRDILRDISFSVYPNQHWVVMGPNGAGKSSLLRLMAGDLRAEPGEGGACLWGFEGRLEPFALAARQHTRLVSPAEQQKYVRQGWKISGLEVILSSLDNAAMLYGEAAREDVARARELAATAGAEYLLDLPVPAMSQGQLRLTLLLRAVFAAPRLLLLDEPFDGLDPRARAVVGRLIAKAVAQGSTLVCTAHRAKDIPPEAANGLMVESGRVTVMPVAELVASLGQGGMAPVAQAKAFRANEAPAAAKGGRAVPTLRLRDVDVYIDRIQALYTINWTVLPGEQWIITGGNGAGKSTLLRLLYGEEFTADGGSLTWFGKRRLPLEAVHRDVGYVSDRLQQTYDYDLTGLELVISGFRGDIGLYREPDEEEMRAARELLDMLDLGPLADTPLSALSSGLGRRFLLARALVGKPRVLLLDEPCSGLDDISRQQFLAALPALAAAGIQMIYVSHHPEDIPPLFDHELALADGRVIYSGERRPIS